MGKKFVFFCSILIFIFALLLHGCSSKPNTTQVKEQEETSIPVTQTTEQVVETESPEIVYARALDYFQAGDYSSARPLFEQLGDYEKSKDYYIADDFMLELAGFYTYWNNNERFIFEIGKTVKVMNGNFTITEFKNVSLENKNDEPRIIAKGDFGTYAFINDNGTIKFFSWGSTPTSRSTADEYKSLTKMPDDFGFPTEPKIGMTAEEVRNSTWGEPQKINTTITAYHTTEQWCYSNDRYVYLEDGIVTSIQK